MGFFRRLMTSQPAPPATPPPFTIDTPVKFRRFYEAPMLYGYVATEPYYEPRYQTWFYTVELTRPSKVKYAKYHHLRCWADVRRQDVDGFSLKPWDGGDQCEVCACGEIHG